MKNVIMQFLVLILFMPNLLAQTRPDTKNQDFYSGGLSIESIIGVIKINKDKEPDLNFNVNISGRRNDLKQDTIGFRGEHVLVSNNSAFKLKPGYIISGKTSTTQSIKVDVVPLINGRVPIEQIGSSQIKFELPEDYIFIRANKPVLISKNGQKTILEFKEQNKYLTPILIVYTTNGMGVSIEKLVNTGSIKKGAVTFILTVTNKGLKQLKNILVEDDLNPNDFSAEGNDFVFYKGEINDSRIFWKKNIESLQPGKSVVIKYTVNAKRDIHSVSLDAAKATIGGVLIGVSNKVKL